MADLTMTFPLTLDIPLRILADTLCSGLEGGSGYWARITEYTEPTAEMTFHIDEGQRFRHIDYPMNEGGAVTLLDVEEGKSYRLDLPALKRGVAIMAAKYPKHFADMVNEGGDSITGDVLIQCSVLGDLVYG